MNTRREFLKAAALATGSVLFGGSICAGARRASRPNIVFIMVDDLGKDYIGCYGSDKAKTPNIDALAAGGMKFNNAYSMPQCVPTRTTLLTGQYPFRHGWINHYDVPRWAKGCHFDIEQNPCMGKIIKSAGYATCISGKWQINDFRVQPNLLRDAGFDECCVWTGFETGNRPSAERYWNPYIHTNEGNRTYEGKFGPDIYNRAAIDFIHKNKSKPMMVYYPMCLTHGPLTTTPHSGDVKNRTVMVEYMDYLVGRVVRALDEAGVRKNTILIWTTDNGPAKGKTTENGACEPFVVNCPGSVPAGVVTDALVDFTDLLPTFAELSGATMPEGPTFDGKSFAPLILGKADDSPRDWIMAMGGGGVQATKTDKGWRVINKTEYRDRVIRDKRYKLYIGTDRKSEKLIDLKADPQEKVNIIDSDRPEVKAALAKLEKVAASFPKKDANPKYTPLPLQDWEKDTESPGTNKANKKRNKRAKR